MANLLIRRLDDSFVKATYVKHVRTLTSGSGSSDIDLFRLEDGTLVECISPENDGRVIPQECDQNADHYPGHRPGR